jgi:hypothetical protein
MVFNSIPGFDAYWVVSTIMGYEPNLGDHQLVWQVQHGSARTTVMNPL